MNSIGRAQHVHVRMEMGSLFILVCHHSLESLGRAAADETDGASPEPAARHSRSDHAWLVCRDFNHLVQFRAADFVIVAQAAVRLRHEDTKRYQVSFE